VLWPATGGFSVLGCNDLGEVFGVSTDAQVLVGVARRAGQPSTTALWKPGTCREDLPPLVANGWSRADAVNGDGTIAGGTAGGPAGTSVPVRWRRIAGAWHIEQLDQRSGFVYGANAAGDLAGYVVNACGDDGGCQRAVVWYASGGFRELGTLGGADSWGRGINAAGEVVGVSTRSDGINTGFLWTQSAGMVELPRNSRWAAANAISDGRSDGTRVAVGMSSSGVPVAWVIRNP
jgi:probable HAF family extracellular repeat protein